MDRGVADAGVEILRVPVGTGALRITTAEWRQIAIVGAPPFRPVILAEPAGRVSLLAADSRPSGSAW
jgi:hypothetical protein